jgi:hypothetical protein
MLFVASAGVIRFDTVKHFGNEGVSFRPTSTSKTAVARDRVNAVLTVVPEQRVIEPGTEPFATADIRS